MPRLWFARSYGTGKWLGSQVHLCLLLLSHVYDMVPASDANLKSWYINKKKNE